MELNSVSVLSQTIRVNNANDEARAYDITADLEIRNGSLASVQSGQLSAQDGSFVVAFSAYGGASNLRVEFNGAQNRTEIISAIDAFFAKSEQFAKENK